MTVREWFRVLRAADLERRGFTPRPELDEFLATFSRRDHHALRVARTALYVQAVLIPLGIRQPDPPGMVTEQTVRIGACLFAGDLRQEFYRAATTWAELRRTAYLGQGEDEQEDERALRAAPRYLLRVEPSLAIADRFEAKFRVEFNFDLPEPQERWTRRLALVKGVA